MIFSMNSLTRLLVALALLLGGCVTMGPAPEPLRVESLRISAPPGFREKVGEMTWSVVAGGGDGELVCELYSRKERVESLEYSGTLCSGHWHGNKPGHYAFKAIVRDRSGQVADSGWSPEYRVAPLVARNALYAVLPVENLSDSQAPLAEIRQGLRDDLSARGLKLLADTELQAFMNRHRLRHVGGMTHELAQKLQDETGVDGVFLTTLESWREVPSPRVSLIMRLVSAGERAEIAWIDSVGLSGDDAPGLLGLGLVKDPRSLLARATNRLLDSLEIYLAEEEPEFRYPTTDSAAQGRLTKAKLLHAGRQTADEALAAKSRRHRPKSFYRASAFIPSARRTVAVVPFLNVNARKHAGELVALHAVKHLHRYANLRVIEPGMVRDTLLSYRMIMQSGPSLAAADVLASESILAADLIVSGKVFDYQGEVGRSQVDFSWQAIDGSHREVVWSSRSYGAGDDDVYFFDLGRVPSAHGLVDSMMRSALARIEEP
jgi:TolB-like protein